MDNEFKVVRFTNISNFDFTSELGAMYAGKPYFVAAGQSLLVPFTLGDHLAKHLAQAILIKGAPIRDSKELDGKGSDRPLWDEQAIIELKGKIVTDVYTEEKPAVLSEAEIMQKKVAELNKVAAVEENGGNVDASSVVPTEIINSDNVYKDKAQVIEELKKREINFNPRSSKKDLESLLG
jgi:hypothetical protein